MNLLVRNCAWRIQEGRREREILSNSLCFRQAWHVRHRPGRTGSLCEDTGSETTTNASYVQFYSLVNFHIHLSLLDRVFSVAHCPSLRDSQRVNKDTESLTILTSPGPCSALSATTAMLAVFELRERQLTPSSYEGAPLYLCGYIPRSYERTVPYCWDIVPSITSQTISDILSRPVSQLRW